MTRRSISLDLPALTARQAEVIIDALNSVVAQLWDAYGDDLRAMHDIQTDIDALRQAEDVPRADEDDIPS